jgi:glycosyltransferase involved in cell wall biosynthesis
MGTKKLRILHIGKFYPPYLGGMETHLEIVCEGLSRSCDVSVVVANDSYKTESHRAGSVAVTRVGSLGRLAGTSISPGMIRAIGSHPAEIVHLHWPNPMAAVAYLASRHTGRLIVTYHSDVVRQRVLAMAFAPVLKMLLDRCDAVIATSQLYLETSEVLRDVQRKCRVIPLGLQTASYASVDRAEVQRIRARFGSRLLLSVGRQVYYKGFEYLITAMQHVDGKVLLVGEGPLRSELESLSKQLGVEDRVVFLGNVHDLVPYYHAADAFVLPSVTRTEAFGIVQIEAMACGRPVINTALDSGVPFVSLHGETGLTVEPKNVQALASALNRLLSDDRLRAQFGSAARRRVEAQFNADAMTQRTLAVYDEVLACAGSVGLEKDYTRGVVTVSS